MVAAGLRGYYLKSWDRAGPLVELEVGGLTETYRLGLLFRTYPGDKTGYFLGGRAEVGPRIGPVRLSLGADFGLLFIPNTLDRLDMLILNLHAVGAVLQLGPVMLHADALSFDVYLVPINTEIGRDPEFSIAPPLTSRCMLLTRLFSKRVSLMRGADWSLTMAAAKPMLSLKVQWVKAGSALS